MSNSPAPKTRKETTVLYKTLAQEYLDGDSSMCQICTPYTERTGFIPDRRAIWRYIRKMRNKNNP